MEIFLGTLGYMIVTFPYALVWHMKIFKAKYEKWQYFGENPSPPIGLLSMVFQGAVLSYGYGIIELEHSLMTNGIKYSLIMGLFFWSTHVIAAMAKNNALRNTGFFTLETIYLTIQFLIFGVVISLVHSMS